MWLNNNNNNWSNEGEKMENEGYGSSTTPSNRGGYQGNNFNPAA